MARLQKPQGWPKYMRSRKMSCGKTAYFWEGPTWARKYKQSPPPIMSEPLGNDYAAAKQKCDDFLNPMFEEWRETRNFNDEEKRSYYFGKKTNCAEGSFRWLAFIFMQSRDFQRVSPATQKHYRQGLEFICQYRLRKDPRGRVFGDISLISIDANAVDNLYDAVQKNDRGGDRKRWAYKAMQSCRRAWNVGHRRKPKIVPSENPFSNMGLKRPRGGEAKPATFEELQHYIKTADDMGYHSIGTAALIGWEFMLRIPNIINSITWSRYRSFDHPDGFEIVHSKNREDVMVMPLTSSTGQAFYAQLENRLAETKKRGTLIVMQDTPDQATGEYRPYKYDQFNYLARKIILKAGLKHLSFSSFRLGGETECGDAELTDTEIMALDGHKTRDMLSIYVRRTIKQRKNASEKRLKSRQTAKFVGMTRDPLSE